MGMGPKEFKDKNGAPIKAGDIGEYFMNSGFDCMVYEIEGTTE